MPDSCARARWRSWECLRARGSAGQIILQALKLNNFEGDIHLVGRSSEAIEGRPVLKSADELPEGVDLAVFTLPAAAVREAIEACARRKVGSALIFAAACFIRSRNRSISAGESWLIACGVRACAKRRRATGNEVSSRVRIEMMHATRISKTEVKPSPASSNKA